MVNQYSEKSDQKFLIQLLEYYYQYHLKTPNVDSNVSKKIVSSLFDFFNKYSEFLLLIFTNDLGFLPLLCFGLFLSLSN